MKKLKFYGLLITCLAMLTCSGCDVMKTAGKVVDKAAYLADDANDETKTICMSNLSYFREALNMRLGPAVYEASALHSSLADTYKKAKEMTEEELLDSDENMLLVDEISKLVFDDDLNINYATISNLDFSIRDMKDSGSFVISHAIMKNDNTEHEVVITWQKTTNFSGTTYPLIFSIKTNE